MLARDVESALTDVLKPEYGVEGETNGLIRGDAENDISHMTFCWTATEEVLRKSIDLGAQAIFAHEPWEIPIYKGGGWWDRPVKKEVPANKKRNALYEEHNLNFFHYHSPLDGWPIWSTGRSLVDALGFDLEKADWPNRFVPVVDIQPQTARNFGKYVSEQLSLKGVGISMDPERQVKRAALMVGGFGGSWGVSEIARKANADVMVVGELSDYTVRCATEADISVVKASHYSTENPAVVKLCEYMGKELDGKVKCMFVDCGESWHNYGEAL